MLCCLTSAFYASQMCNLSSAPVIHTAHSSSLSLCSSALKPSCWPLVNMLLPTFLILATTVVCGKTLDLLLALADTLFTNVSFINFCVLPNARLTLIIKTLFLYVRNSTADSAAKPTATASCSHLAALLYSFSLLPYNRSQWEGETRCLLPRSFCYWWWYIL